MVDAGGSRPAKISLSPARQRGSIIRHLKHCNTQQMHGSTRGGQAEAELVRLCGWQAGTRPDSQHAEARGHVHVYTRASVGSLARRAHQEYVVCQMLTSTWMRGHLVPACCTSSLMSAQHSRAQHSTATASRSVGPNPDQRKMLGRWLSGWGPAHAGQGLAAAAMRAGARGRHRAAGACLRGRRR